jgi:peptidoglycan hydrolase-like protein with peptidoglycan-binding domain
VVAMLTGIVLTLATIVVGSGEAMAAGPISTRQLQWDLAALAYLPMSGIDGVPGSQTTTAVKVFQADQCLVADGVAGALTEAAFAGGRAGAGRRACGP